MENTGFSFLTNQQARELLREELESFFAKNQLQFRPDNQESKVVDLDGLLIARPMIGCKSTVYKKASRGEIPHSKNGKRLVFDLEEIDRWLLANKVKTANEINSEAKTLTNVRYTRRRRFDSIEE